MGHIDGLATDAGVDHLPARLLFAQPLVEQGHPALFALNTVSGADTVAQHQNIGARAGVSRRPPKNEN